MPLIKRDLRGSNGVSETFSLPSYLGRSDSETNYEGINCIAAVLSAALCGVDKQNQNGKNFVEMCECFFNRDNGENLVLNNVNTHTGGSFWYEIYPHVLFYALTSCYPDTPNFKEIVRITADKWVDACVVLSENGTIPDFDHLSYNHLTHKAVDNGSWIEPEAAAGVAFLLYSAYELFGDEKYLDYAKRCMDFLETHKDNPYYEILLPFGAYIAARLNAEQGTNYNICKIIDWCFDGDSACRPGWGVIAEKWGAYDCHGLVGSLIDWGQRWDVVGKDGFKDIQWDSAGYAFVTNTFSMAAGIIPIARYDTDLAHDIGKWMLNAANAARLFYPNFHDEKHQSCAFLNHPQKHVFGYEGLRKSWDSISPYATGDPIRYSWGAIDLGLYGSSHVGIFGGIIEKTDVEGILRLDCLKTDYFNRGAYPTYLYYNPHDTVQKPTIKIEAAVSDIYDAVSKRWVAKGVKASFTLELEPDDCAVLVMVSSGSTIIRKEDRLYADGVIIDYSC